MQATTLNIPVERIGELELGTAVSFTYHGKTRVGIIDRFTAYGVTLKLSVDGTNVHRLEDQHFKTFNLNKIEGDVTVIAE